MCNTRMARREFLRRTGRSVVMAVGIAAASAGCGGSDDSMSPVLPGDTLTPASPLVPRFYTVRPLFGLDGQGRGRYSESDPREYRQESLGRINSRGDVAAVDVQEYGDDGSAGVYRNGVLLRASVSATPAGTQSLTKPLDLNDRGELLVSQEIFGDGGSNRYFLCENGATRLIELPYEQYSYFFGNDINNRGDFVGSLNATEQEQRAFLWRDEKLTVFGPDSCDIVSINDAGQMLGSLYERPDYASRLVLWQDTQTFVELNLPSDAFKQVTLNEEGVVLLTRTRSSTDSTYLWTPTQANGASGSVTAVAGMPTGFRGADMNRQRDFVGSGYTDRHPASYRAFIRRSGAQAAEDLNTLIPADSGWILEQAYGINDAGLITVLGSQDRGNGFRERSLLLLTPR